MHHRAKYLFGVQSFNFIIEIPLTFHLSVLNLVQFNKEIVSL